MENLTVCKVVAYEANDLRRMNVQSRVCLTPRRELIFPERSKADNSV